MTLPQEPVWLRVCGADVVLALYIQPGAKKTEVVGEHGAALKIRLQAPPVDGKANDCLIAFLAKRLALPKSRLTLEAGHTTRMKRIRVLACDAATVLSQLVWLA